MMNAFICVTCGTQFAPSDEPPPACPICQDERQYVNATGQQWATLAALRVEHQNLIRDEAPDLVGVGTEPAFAIAQRALLVRSPGGNVLWDCVSLLDDTTVARMREQGGIAAIAISHPHYYSSMVEWSRAFEAPILLHADDRRHVMRPDPAINFWEGDTFALHDGITLLRTGGHFDGGTVLHWPAGAGGRGALLSGDLLNVLPDRRYVSFMYSYPNLIPLPEHEVRRIAAAVEPWPFEAIYGAWWGRIMPADGNAVVQRSAERYIRALRGEYPDERNKRAAGDDR